MTEEIALDKTEGMRTSWQCMTNGMRSEASVQHAKWMATAVQEMPNVERFGSRFRTAMLLMQRAT